MSSDLNRATPRQIAQPILRGYYPVRALLFAPDQAPCILAFWRVGARMQTLQHARCQGILLTLPEPERFEVEHLPAQAFVDAQVFGANTQVVRALWACVPRAAALADPALVNAALVLCLGYELVSISASELQTLDPAQCVDLTDVYWVNPPVSAVPEITSVQINVPPSADARALLTGSVQDPAAKDFLQQLRTGKSSRSNSSALRGLLGGLGQALLSAVGSRKNRQGQEQGPGKSSKPGLLQRLGMALMLQKMLGPQHARFLQRMMQDLENGDWSEALKRAIPLGELSNNPGPPKLGLWMSARQDLRWTHQSGASIGLPPNLLQQLEQQYRMAFRALDAAGRYEEAAFVLIELLRETQEGVDYLLKHKQIRKAAELAEARALAPAKVVKLWLLAGETARALRIARLTGCFEQVMPLMHDRPELAVQFRTDWAAYLLSNQDYTRAVRVLWQLPEQRARAALIIETAKLRDPSLLPELLALQLCLMPEQFSQYEPELQQLLEHPGTAASLRRESFARTLLDYLPEAPIGLIGVALMRALMQDYARGDASPYGALLKTLEKASNDPLWNADRSRADPLTPAVQFLERREAVTLDATHDPQVVLEIFDAHALGDGRYLLALGESGVLLMHQDGRKLMHFAQPATRLIPSHAGGKHGLWITVQPRPSASRSAKSLYALGRLDLVKLHGKPWCVTELSCFAQYAENGLWPVALHRSMMLIDLQKPGFEAFWSVTDLPAPVEAMRLSPTELQLLLGSEQSQHWRYRWPEMSLSQRAELAQSPRRYQLGDAIWQAQIFNSSLDPSAPSDMALKRPPLLNFLRPGAPDRLFNAPEWTTTIELIQRARWLATIWSAEDGRFQVELHTPQASPTNGSHGVPLLNWFVESNCRPRVDGDHANIYLSHGTQLVHIELDSGRINKLRVS